MSHSDDESTCVLLHRRVDAVFESWYKRLTPLKTEPLHSVELARHEGTPLVCVVKSRVHVNALSFGSFSELNRFKFFTNPITDFALLDMHELHSNFSAVGLTICGNKIAQFPTLLTLGNAAEIVHSERELTVHVGLRESVLRRVKQRKGVLIREAELLRQTWTVTVDLLELQRIDIRSVVPMRHEGAQKHVQANCFVVGLPFITTLEADAAPL